MIADAPARELRRQALEAMQPFLSRLMAKPECLGIGLLSSTAEIPSRPCRFSAQSDFDVSILIDVPMTSQEWQPAAHQAYALLQDRLPPWLPNFLFYVEVPWGQMEVNAHQLVYPYEFDDRTTWDDDKRDAYANKLQLIHDPEGRFRALVDRKTATWTAADREQARLTNRLTWDIAYGPLKQAGRHGSLTGHYMLNVAIEELLDLLYLRASLPVPNKKWKISGLEAEGVLGPGELALLESALDCRARDTDDLARRARNLESLARTLGLPVDDDAWVLRTRRHFQTYLEPLRETMADRAAVLAGDAEASEWLRNAVNFALPGNAEELRQHAAAAVPSSAGTELQALARTLLSEVE